jgi:hypothetical protein
MTNGTATPPPSEGVHPFSPSNPKLNAFQKFLRARMTFISALTTATVALIASVLNCRFGWYADPRTVLAARADQRTAFWGQEENGLKKGGGENAAEPGGH